MNTPTAAAVREWSNVDFATKGYPEPGPSEPDRLQTVVDRAAAYVTFVTARPLDSTMPALFMPLAQQAVQMRTEQIVERSQGDVVESAGDIDMIASFSAGDYSETRKDTGKRETQTNLNPWPALNELLWMLLGLAPGETNEAVSERLDWWRYMLGMQPNAPAWQMVEVAWRANGYGAYGYAPLGVFDGYVLEPGDPYPLPG